jgi:hypothetical protein
VAFRENCGYQIAACVFERQKGLIGRGVEKLNYEVQAVGWREENYFFGFNLQREVNEKAKVFC